MKKDIRGQKRFLSFLKKEVSDPSRFESPMALYKWLVQEWKSPLNLQAMRHAYLASWAFSIDNGVVDL